MRIRLGRFASSLLCFTGLILTAPLIEAQQKANAPGPQQVATMLNSSNSKTATPNVPVFKDYRGITIGMTSKEVRDKLDDLKKGERQDFMTSSDGESAQIFYDQSGKVTAISVDYFGDNSNPPSPDLILGVTLEAKADGSMYQLKRYPEAGYWVSYNRTAGDKPIITITMQKI